MQDAVDPHPEQRRAPSLGRRLLVVAAIGAVFLALVASCGDSDGGRAVAGPDDGKLTVRSVRVEEPVNGKTAVVRMVIDNGTDDDDELLSVTSPEAASATLHRSEVDDEERSTMAAEASIDVPAHRSTRFEAGGLHVMLSQFTTELVVGTEVELTLTFDQAGERTVTGTVVPLGVTGGDDGHEMGDMDHAGG